MMTGLKSKATRYLPLVVILVLGLAIRLQFLNMPIYGDEYTVVAAAASSAAGRLPWLNFGYPNTEGLGALSHPPFTIVAYGFVFKLFGVSVVAARAFLIALSVVKMLLVYLITASAFNRAAGLVSAGIYAFAWDAATVDVAILNDPLSYFLILVFVFLLQRSIKDNKKALGASFFLGLSLFTYIIPTLFAWVAFSLSNILIERKKNIRLLFTVLFGGVFFYVFFYAAYILILKGTPQMFLWPLEYLFITKSGAYLPSPGILELAKGMGKSAVTVLLHPSGMLPLLVLSILNLPNLLKANKAEKSFIVGSLFLSVLMLVVTSRFYVAKYTDAAYPFFSIVFGTTIVSLVHRLNNFLYRYALAAAAILAFLVSVLLKYSPSLTSYFWQPLASSKFMLFWYAPLFAVAFLVLALHVAARIRRGGNAMQKIAMLCLAAFVAYNLAAYGAFYMNLPVMAMGGGYAKHDLGIMETADFVKSNLGQNETVISPWEIAYYADLQNRFMFSSGGALSYGKNFYADRTYRIYLPPFSNELLDEKKVVHLPPFSTKLLDENNVGMVIEQENKIKAVPEDIISEIRARYPITTRIGDYYVFSSSTR